MKNVLKLLFLSICICTLILTSFSSTAFAYYNRGKVKVSVGSTNITLAKGSSSSVTININPASRTGLPGCGEPGCPQTCGGLCGDEKNGECPCAGETPVTHNATASVQSSNSTIANAGYSNGAITINGISAGKTQITVTGSLWQYTNSDPVIINVTVTSSGNNNNSGSASNNNGNSNTPAPTPSNTTSSSNSSNTSGNSGTSTSNTVNSSKTVSGSNNNSSSGIVAVTPGAATSKTDNKQASSGVVAVAPDSNTNNATDTKQTANVSENQISVNPSSTESENNNNKTDEVKKEDTTINGHKGIIEIITLTSNEKTGKDILEKTKGQNRKITFQKKDSSNNVLYSWSYNGQDIKNPMDIDMSISFPGVSGKEAELSKNLINPLFITFAHSGELPGKANIYIKASSQYKNNDVLSLYYYNKTTNKLELIQENIKVSGGYISFNITHCSEYFLASGMKKSNNIWIIILIIILALAAAIVFLLSKKTNLANRIFKLKK